MDGQIAYSKMTGRPSSQGTAGLSNGEPQPRARFPHLKDLIATVDTQILGLIPATPVCILYPMYHGGEKFSPGHVHSTLDHRTFAQSGRVSNSRHRERELQETGSCLCGLCDQFRDPIEHNS